MAEAALTGAESLIQTLTQLQVDHCFANPGTSEMHLVKAMEKSATMRSVLCLFEGVCTGAADGFARAAGRPATTLLHLGVGLANGVSNLHNARRADTPLINLIGDHAHAHRALDAPLTSDIETLAGTFSCWVRTSESAQTLARDGAEAVRATKTRKPDAIGRIASLIIPADCAWHQGKGVDEIPLSHEKTAISTGRVHRIAQTLDKQSLLLLGNSALTQAGIRAAGRICKATGCRMMTITFPAVLPLGPNLPHMPRLPYFPEQVVSALEGVQHLVLVGATAPVSFFAYPDRASELTPEEAHIHNLAAPHENAAAFLEATAEALQATDEVSQTQERPEPPQGALSARAIAQSLAARVPENAIISTDSGGGGVAFEPVQKAAPVLWMNLSGGAIGQGGPAATGAALACPDRRVIALLGDGGALYTNQFLWTQARENLDVTTVIYNNASYNILAIEYGRLGLAVPDTDNPLFDLDHPGVDWVALGNGLGVPCIKATEAESFDRALQKSLATPGPMLIDATLS